MKNRRISMMGPNNPRWHGGTSEYPDHYELKKNRTFILRRSKGKCEICSNRARLVHHIDGSKNNHKLNNLMAVCLFCHWSLHAEEHEGLPQIKRTTKTIQKFGMTIEEIAKHLGLKVPATRYHIKKLTKPLPSSHQKSREINMKLRELFSSGDSA